MITRLCLAAQLPACTPSAADSVIVTMISAHVLPAGEPDPLRAYLFFACSSSKVTKVAAPARSKRVCRQQQQQEQQGDNR
jgi:hypothetical protein